MHNQDFILSMGMIVTLVIASACASSPGQPPESPSPVPLPVATLQTKSPIPSAVFILKVDSLAPGSVLPDGFTCKGITGSPEVSWDGIPPGAKSLVLIMDDPDAPAGTFTHWIVYNIPPEPDMLSTSQPDVTVLPDGARQGNSSAGSRGYYPPCPPIGTIHHYVFHLYAVDLELSERMDGRPSIDTAMNGHTIANVEFITTFGR